MSAQMENARFAALTREERAILRERSKQTARVVSVVASERDVEVLELASRGQIFVVPIGAVEGVSELSSLAAVPRSSSFVRGLVGFRGEVLVAVELSGSGDGGRTGGGFADLRRLVCLAAGGRKVAVLCERAMVVRTVDPAEFVSDALARSSFIVGTSPEFVSLVDPGAFIQHVFASLGGDP